MDRAVACPVHMCTFDGTIRDVANHIQEHSDESHRWEALRWDDRDEFCRTTHFEEGQRFEQLGQDAWDHGDYEGAIENLEDGTSHFQRAQEFADDPSTLTERCQDIRDRIADIEVAEQIRGCHRKRHTRRRRMLELCLRAPASCKRRLLSTSSSM
jgi:hypothetical protein